MLQQVTDHLLKAPIMDVTHIDSDISLILAETKLWVTTPWRLEKDGKIVMGNDNLIELLYHEDYKDDYNAALEFIKDSLKGTIIEKVEYTNFNELTMTMSNGFIFRSFQTNGSDEEDADNFQLYLEKQRYIVCPKTVELEDLGPFYRRE